MKSLIKSLISITINGFLIFGVLHFTETTNQQMYIVLVLLVCLYIHGYVRGLYDEAH